MNYQNSSRTDPELIVGGQDTLTGHFSLQFLWKLLFLWYIEIFNEFSFLPEYPRSFPDWACSEQCVRFWGTWRKFFLVHCSSVFFVRFFLLVVSLQVPESWLGYHLDVQYHESSPSPTWLWMLLLEYASLWSPARAPRQLETVTYAK